MFEKLQDWIIDKIPAQRKAREQTRKLRDANKKQMSRNFDSLPEHKKRDLMQDATVAAFMRKPHEGDERRYADN